MRFWVLVNHTSESHKHISRNICTLLEWKNVRATAASGMGTSDHKLNVQVLLMHITLKCEDLERVIMHLLFMMYKKNLKSGVGVQWGDKYRMPNYFQDSLNSTSRNHALGYHWNSPFLLLPISEEYWCTWRQKNPTVQHSISASACYVLECQLLLGGRCHVPGFWGGGWQRDRHAAQGSGFLTS